jgi:hypothetical protein
VAGSHWPQAAPWRITCAWVVARPRNNMPLAPTSRRRARPLARARARECPRRGTWWAPTGCPGTRGAWEPPPPPTGHVATRERPPPRSVAWADWFGRFFPFSTRFSHGSTDSAPVQAPRARFSPGFLLHRLRHLPLHATVLWEGQLHLRKEGGPPLSQVSPYK